MVRKSIFGLIGVSALVAVCIALWKAWGPGTRTTSRDGEWENAPVSLQPVPELVTVPRRNAWIEPVDGACPASHPIKAKLSSGIYHSPGGMNYQRTHPDRCYIDGGAAERDGLRPAKL
jgi:hypothetical protein